LAYCLPDPRIFGSAFARGPVELRDGARTFRGSSPGARARRPGSGLRSRPSRCRVSIRHLLEGRGGCCGRTAIGASQTLGIIATLISPSPLTDSEIRFAGRAARRGHLFLALACGGVLIALALSVFYGYRRWTDPNFPVGVRAVVVLLILLNARQNLRQYRYASLLRKLGDLRGANRTP